jgi:small subunit ribosomal protein S20
MKTSAAERSRNRGYRSQLRDAVKAVRGGTKKAEAMKAFQQAVKILDKAAASGLIHKNNAARNKSRLAQFVAKMA